MRKQVAAADGLTEQQAAFVDAYVANGGNAEQAAIAAGYAPGSARVSGPRILKLPKVQEVLLQRCRESLSVLAPVAVHQLERLVTSAKSERIRLEAAELVLRLVGIGEVGAGSRQQSIGALFVVDLGGDSSGRTGAEPARTVDLRPIRDD